MADFGLNVHVPSDELLEQVALAGIKHVRVDVVPSSIKRFRRVVNTCEGLGLKILAVPHNLSSTVQVMDWVREFEGRIEAWSLGNEPNLTKYWSGSQEDWLTRAGEWAKQIRRIDPQALIVGPDLSHADNWHEWMRAFVRLFKATKAPLDVIAHHVYAGDNHWRYWWKMKSPIPCVHSVHREMRKLGWWGGPLWITENGTATDRYGVYGQMKMTQEICEKPYANRVYFYEAVDDRRVDPSGKPYPRYGLRYTTSDPKPAWYTLTREIHRV